MTREELELTLLRQVLKMVPTMPVDDKAQRTLRATIRRWAKAVRDAGHDVPEE